MWHTISRMIPSHTRRTAIFPSRSGSPEWAFPSLYAQDLRDVVVLEFVTQVSYINTNESVEVDSQG